MDNINSKKYNFSDFTLDEYAELIDIAKKNYTFTNFKDFNKSNREIIWRHDIDMSPSMALKMAEIEHEKSVKATYFILLHSEFYNLLDKKNTSTIRRIIELGHNVELHFDSFYYNINSEDQLADNLITEKKILERIFNIEISAFSFHNNTPFTLSCDKEHYGGLINAYSKGFKSIPYCSDSNGYWRFRRLRDVLEAGDDYNLQILTHEVWWQEKVMSPKEKILNVLKENQDLIYKSYTDTLDRLNLINVDWE